MPGTPVTFKRFTRREFGWVGGFPQTNLFRTWGPKLGRDLWMVGDSIFPGQSTAAVALGGIRVAESVLREVGVSVPVGQQTTGFPADRLGESMLRGKIGIVGSGFVGATAAYAMVMRGVGREIVLVDLNQKRAEAEANDIRHAIPFAHPMTIRAGGYEDLAGANVVVITAGVNQKPGETRLQLLERNGAVFRQIVPAILAHAPTAKLVVATNPVDITTHLTVQIARELGAPVQGIFGSGTTLDTARFRTLLGHKVGVDPQHVHAYVLGEHGDSEVLAWSQVTIGGTSLDEFCRRQGIELTDADRADIDQRVRRAAYSIIDGKGATYYGIGSALARIVESVIEDQRTILTVCAPTEDVAGVKDVTLALPRLVGGEGILASFPQPLSDDEEAALHRSATIIRDAITGLGM